MAIVAGMDRSIIHDTHMAINFAHRLVYFVPEAAEEYTALGVTGRGSYFASRIAPMGSVPNQVIVATFYNFHTRAVESAMPGVWDATTPAAFQAARFRTVKRAVERIGVGVPLEEIAEARAIVDPVVAGLDLAGKPLGAANASVVLPDDPFVALWQQLTVIREWRGDAHIAVLIANRVGPCECMVLQVGTGRFPLGVTQATRQWNETEWAEAVKNLFGRGWVDATGAMTPLGTAERERIEDETDALCEPIWKCVTEAEVKRLGEIVGPIHTAVAAAGTYGSLA